MIDFVISGILNFTFGLLECDCFVGDIVIPWIVNSGVLFHTLYILLSVTLAVLKNVNRYIGNIILKMVVRVPLYHHCYHCQV